MTDQDPTKDQPRRSTDPLDHPLESADVLEVLKMVIDPELGINVVDLGLIYEVDVDDDEVAVTYTLTSMGCPVGPLIEQQIQQVITTLPGVASVKSKVTFDPPWSMEKMTEDARLAMGMF